MSQIFNFHKKDDKQQNRYILLINVYIKHTHIKFYKYYKNNLNEPKQIHKYKLRGYFLICLKVYNTHTVCKPLIVAISCQSWALTENKKSRI